MLDVAAVVLETDREGVENPVWTELAAKTEEMDDPT